MDKGHDKGQMSDREVMKLALEALDQYIEKELTVGQRYTNEGQQLLDAHAILRQALEQQEQEPFCFHDGRNIVGKEYADHSDVFPLYTSPNPEQQKPVRFNCTVIDDAHLNGVPLSQWGKQHEMQPCAGRNCGSTNPNLHSAECFEDYEKVTGMEQPEQEPVDSPEKAGAYMDARLWEFIYMAAAWPEAKTDTRIWDHVLVYAPKRPEQEPVAWMYTSQYKGNERYITRYQSELTTYKAVDVWPLYTAPPKRKWQGLTDEEIFDVIRSLCIDNETAEMLIHVSMDEYRAIEAKLKEKNT